MILATVTLLLLIFGGSLEQSLLNIKKPVKAAVENKQAVGQIVGLSKDLGKQLKVHNKEMTRSVESFFDLHVDYDATAGNFEHALDRIMAVREAGQKDILDTRQAMKELMTKEEWTEVFNP
jgi:hypothetical protein